MNKSKYLIVTMVAVIGITGGMSIFKYSKPKLSLDQTQVIQTMSEELRDYTLTLDIEKQKEIADVILNTKNLLYVGEK